MADLRDFAQQLDDEAQLYLYDNNNSRPQAFAHSLVERLKDTLSIENYTIGYKVQKSQDGRYLGEIFGYSLSTNGEVLTLIYSLYNDNVKDGIITLRDADYQLAINRLQGFYLQCYNGNVAQEIEQDDPLYELSELLRDKPKEVKIGRPQKNEGPQIITVRLLIFSNSFIKDNDIKKHRINGRNVVPEVYDIARLYQLFGSDSDHRIINIDFIESFKYRIPFIEMEAQAVGYKCFMTMFPGKLLYRLYEDYNTDLLLNNVRFYLGLKGKQENNANVGIQETLRNEKHMFLAYNNGIVALADKVITESNTDSINVEEESERADYVKSGIIKSIEDFQIVNGGQTTATLFYSKKQNSKEPISMLGVYIPVKIIVIDGDENDKKRIATNVTKFSNSQSKVKPGDFSSSNEFNTTMEELSRSIATSGGKKWYYERLRGQYDQEFSRKTKSKEEQQLFKSTYDKKERFFRKELLAKVWKCFQNAPYDVVKGEATNYKLFMDKIVSNCMIPDEDYYKKSIGLLILWNYIYNMPDVKDKANCRAPLTAYTLSFMLNSRSKEFDLLRIWDDQNLGKNLCEYLIRLSRLMNDVLNRLAHEEQKSVLSLSKNIGTYTAVKNEGILIDQHLIDDYYL